jgi:hypothetical protein
MASHTSIVMAATAVGETETASIELQNTSPYKVTVEVLPPQLEATPTATGPEYQPGYDASATRTPGALMPTNLIISPSISSIEAGGMLRLLLQYHPTKEEKELRAAEKDSSGAIHSRWIVSITAMRERERPALAALDADSAALLAGQGVDGDGQAAESGAVAGDTVQRGTVSISAKPRPLVESQLALQVYASLLSGGLVVDQKFLAFSEVPVGQTETRSLRVRNSSDLPLSVTATLPDASGPFAVLSAPRVLKPGGSGDITLSFKPNAHRIFSQTLTVGGEEYSPSLRVHLSGHGVSPSIFVDPPESARVDFGSVVAGDTVTRKVFLRNSSSFPLHFQLRRIDQARSLEVGDGPVFFWDPMEGTIDSGKVAPVFVHYNPKCELPGTQQHTAVFEVDVPNQDEESRLRNRLVLSGRAFEQNYYIAPVDPALYKAPSDPSVFWSLLAGQSVTAADDKALADRYVLTFPEPAEHQPAAPEPAAQAKAPAKGQAVAALSEPTSNVYSLVELMVHCIKREGTGGILAGQSLAAASGKTEDKAASAAAAKGGKDSARKAAAPAVSETAPGTTAAPASAPISFKVNLPPTASTGEPHFFTVVEPAGSSTPAPAAGASWTQVGPGGTQRIAFRFTPPPPLGGGVTNAEKTKGIITTGTWSVVDATVTVTGGVSTPLQLHGFSGAAGSAAERVIPVRLKAFVPIA